LVVYVEDPHPGEPAFRHYTQPETFEERRRYADRLVAERGMEVTVVVDEMEDTVWKQYGSLPNMVYVIDRDGKVAYHATWTMADRIEKVLADLVA
jgi:peroxiredoxin